MTEPLVSLLTPTGGRPDAWKLCEKYVKRQTYKGPLEWIVVDDMKPMQNCTMGQIHLEGPKLWRPGINTQRPNMELALQRCKGEYIFVWEDDDWYAANYIETMLFMLQRFEACGEANNRYFALQDRRYINFRNTEHASLCSTAMRRSMIPVLDEAINSGDTPFFDIAFWKRVRTQRRDAVMLLYSDLNVGMKQLPGRMGIGAGHTDTAAQGFQRDPTFDVLRSWIGQDDLDSYIKLATGQPL